ncbi:MAG TPA: OsmC family peroxiredoxin [Deltaproteobacteria bacterium]|nr:OsmC family peroxiredoxin [Deltaproteobacteria bacterium]
MDSTVTLTGGMAFDAQVDGHTLVIDAKTEHGGHDAGPSPKTLVLTGLAGCAAMDIISILRKMRAEPSSLSVTAAAQLSEDHPKVFVEPVVTVRATGDIPTKKLWRAVALSRDRYCGVAAMLRAHAPIRYVVELDGVEIPEPTE